MDTVTTMPRKREKVDPNKSPYFGIRIKALSVDELAILRAMIVYDVADYKQYPVLRNKLKAVCHELVKRTGDHKYLITKG